MIPVLILVCLMCLAYICALKRNISDLRLKLDFYKAFLEVEHCD